MITWLDFDPTAPFTFLHGAFWLFFLGVLAGFAVLEKHISRRNAFLFLVSLLFYWKTSGWFFLILLFSTISDWSIAWRMDQTTGSKRKMWLALSMVLNLGLLIYFKYAYFLADSINPLLGTHWNPQNALGEWTNQTLGTSFRVDRILLPVGISFYTFQTMSYALDVYRRDIRPVRSLWDFGFFVSFFPQLVAGPIVRAKEFMPQLHKAYSLTRKDFGMALFWILNGLIKKVWLADYIAVNLVDRVFANPGSFTGFENVLGLYGYSLQVYADFSGYTDMAIGIALLMGFHLPVNFRAPYKARHVGEFWKRWHISLSSWLKDYLYIPMGGNRRATRFTAISGAFFFGFFCLLAPSAGVIMIGIGFLLLLTAAAWIYPGLRRNIITNINIMMTMLLGGLWHGASWNFVLWGALNGTGLLVYKAWRKWSPWEVKDRWWKHAVGILLTFHFITFTRIWFRSGSKTTWDTVGTQHDIWAEWFTANDMILQIIRHFWDSPMAQIILAYQSVISVMVIGFAIHFIPEYWKTRYRLAFAQAPTPAQAIAVIAAIGLAWAGLQSGLQPFIYFQF